MRLRRLLAFVLLAALLAGGYLFYRHNYQTASAVPSLPQMNITQVPYRFDSLSQVLGTATTSVLNTLNNVTDGQAEPLINRTLENLQNEVKDLPREQYEKVKIEFCQDVITQHQEDQANE